MSYVYKYVDSSADSVVYVGKVSDNSFTALQARHNQHKKDSWYSCKLSFFYLVLPSYADADIYETYFISKYSSNALENKAKMWGASTVQLNEDSLQWILYEDKEKRPSPFSAEIVGYISFDKLPVLMKSKGVKKYDLRKAGVNAQILDKAIKGSGNIDTRTILKICALLDCQPGDIMAYIKE